MIDENKLIDDLIKCKELDRSSCMKISEIINNQPKINEWIPCIERLPDEYESVLVWYEYFRYGDYNGMFQTYGIGYQTEGKWFGDVQGVRAKCIAWTPFPKPYKPK